MKFQFGSDSNLQLAKQELLYGMQENEYEVDEDSGTVTITANPGPTLEQVLEDLGERIDED